MRKSRFIIRGLRTKILCQVYKFRKNRFIKPFIGYSENFKINKRDIIQ